MGPVVRNQGLVAVNEQGCVSAVVAVETDARVGNQVCCLVDAEEAAEELLSDEVRGADAKVKSGVTVAGEAKGVGEVLAERQRTD